MIRTFKLAKVETVVDTVLRTKRISALNGSSNSSTLIFVIGSEGIGKTTVTDRFHETFKSKANGFGKDLSLFPDALLRQRGREDFLNMEAVSDFIDLHAKDEIVLFDSDSSNIEDVLKYCKDEFDILILIPVRDFASYIASKVGRILIDQTSECDVETCVVKQLKNRRIEGFNDRDQLSDDAICFKSGKCNNIKRDRNSEVSWMTRKEFRTYHATLARSLRDRFPSISVWMVPIDDENEFDQKQLLTKNTQF
jgi:hypothetical protein